MKTRLALARSILHRPELLLFDEPTSGLDPESSHAVLELIRELTLEGRTVVMCTHLLSEAEGLADHVVMMEGGTDLISGTPDGADPPVLAEPDRAPRRRGRPRCWTAWPAGPGCAPTAAIPAGARLELDDLARLPDMVASLVADGARLTRVEPHVPTLEDLYFTIRRQAGGTTDAPSDDDGRSTAGADPAPVGRRGTDHPAAVGRPTGAAREPAPCIRRGARRRPRRHDDDRRRPHPARPSADEPPPVAHTAGSTATACGSSPAPSCASCCCRRTTGSRWWRSAASSS